MSSRSSSSAKRAKVIPADAVPSQEPVTVVAPDVSPDQLIREAPNDLFPSAPPTAPLAISSTATAALPPGALSMDDLGPSSSDPALQNAALVPDEELDGPTAPVDLVCRP